MALLSLVGPLFKSIPYCRKEERNPYHQVRPILQFLLFAIPFLFLLQSLNSYAYVINDLAPGRIQIDQFDPNNDIANLDHKWLFNWEKPIPENDEYQKLVTHRHDWLADPDIGNQGEKAHGVAYYRSYITLKSEKQLAINLGYQYTSYKFWINDQLLISNGEHVGERKSPGVRKETLVTVPADCRQGCTLKLDLMVANYHHPWGGVDAMLQLGSSDEIFTEMLLDRVLVVINLAAIMLAGMGFLVASFLPASATVRTQYIHLVILSLGTFYRFVFLPPYISYDVFGWRSFELALHGEYSGYIVTSVAILSFSCLLRSNRWLVLYRNIAVVIGILLFVIIHTVSINDYRPYISIVNLFTTSCILLGIINGMMTKERFYIFCFSFILIMTWFDLSATMQGTFAEYPFHLFSFNFYLLCWVIRFYSLFINKSKEALRYREHTAHLHKELKKLVYPHQVSQIHDGLDYEQTMPETSEKACVLCFDIQQSTQIGHSVHHHFFSDVLKKCYREMIKDYNPETLESRAYMVKEMGDGFLCSVGYPFRQKQDPFQASYTLAMDFVKVFRECCRRDFPDRDIHCSIGIAYGNLTGKFPKTGLKFYDIFGDAIVQATRYEAARKMIFLTDEKPGDIIVVQDKVFQSLPDEQKMCFQRYQLENFKMRDDPQATHLYYQIVASDRQQDLDASA